MLLFLENFMMSELDPVRFHQMNSNKWETIDNYVIVEKPVSLFVNNELWLTFMCTPNQLEALAAGFLFNEGAIATKTEIIDIHICESGDVIDVWLEHGAQKPKEWKRTSGCTGGYTGTDILTLKPEIFNGVSISAHCVHEMVAKLFRTQDLYQKAGGVHTSILSDGNEVNVMAEDVGRHNSLDKLAGRMLLEEIDMSRKIILTTGRISSDMLQKAANIGAPVVISRTSPTSLSIELAEKWGITLIGYARRNRFNLYTHPGRIIEYQSEEAHQVK
jgi:FdhD protein